MSKRIVILGSDTNSVGYLYRMFGSDVVGVVVERPVGKFQIIRRRLKRYGFIATVGQVLFVLLLLPIIRAVSAKRTRALVTTHQINADALTPELLHNVASVNSKETVALLETLAPTHIVVYGTRVIKESVLKKISASWINIHAGITPRYRGGHGAYWAFAEGKPTLAGVTVHSVDAGIDTGAILAQGVITKEPLDTIVTYPLLQLVEGATLTLAVLEGRNLHDMPKSTEHTERLYTHPTLWDYLFILVTKGIA